MAAAIAKPADMIGTYASSGTPKISHARSGPICRPDAHRTGSVEAAPAANHTRRTLPVLSGHHNDRSQGIRNHRPTQSAAPAMTAIQSVPKTPRPPP